MDNEVSGAETATEETATVDTGDQSSGGGEVETSEQPAKSADWRVQRYGEDYQNNLEYLRDTNKYLRGQLDKRTRAQRGIEDEETETRTTVAPKNNDGEVDEVSAAQTAKELAAAIEKRQELKFEKLLSEREQRTTFRTSMAQARQVFNGEDGFPAFSDLEQEVLVPLVKNTPDVLKILRALPDPGAAAMTLALVLKAKTPQGLRKMFASEGYQELTDKINDATKEAVRIKGGKGGKINNKLSPEDIKNMTSEEFEKYERRVLGRG